MLYDSEYAHFLIELASHGYFLFYFDVYDVCSCQSISSSRFKVPLVD